MTKAQEKSKGEVANLSDAGSQLPAHLQKMQEHAGAGTSQAAEDNIVPMVAVLQPLSPQVDRRNPKYIEAAEPGAIWLKNAPTPIISGDEGIVFQPCFFSRHIVEWVPREQGGGYVARHDEMPAEARTIKSRDGKRDVWVMPNGNQLIDTRYHVGNVVFPDGTIMPYVIPFSSSGHTVSRTWHTLMNSIRLPSGDIAPSFARVYRLKTIQRTNAAGTWFVFDVSHEGWAPEQLYDRGLELHESFKAGEKAVETDAGQQEHQGASGESAPF
jgi:hypothetical protein